MYQRGIGPEPDPVAGLELVALAEYRDDVLAADFGEDLRLGAGRLHHNNFGFGAVVRDRKVLRADAVDGRTAIRGRRRDTERQRHAVWPLEAEVPIRLDLAVQKIHRRRTDEARNEQVVGLVVEI